MRSLSLLPKGARTLLSAVALLSACLTLTSCMVAKGTGWYYASLGTDVDAPDISASGLKAKKINQSKGLKEAGGVVRDGIKTTIMGGLVKEGMNTTESVLNDVIN
jgi:hypothetical protein